MKSLSKYLSIRIVLVSLVVLFFIYTIISYLTEKKFELEFSKTLDTVHSTKVAGANFILGSSKSFSLNDKTYSLAAVILKGENISEEKSTTTKTTATTKATSTKSTTEKTKVKTEVVDCEKDTKNKNCLTLREDINQNFFNPENNYLEVAVFNETGERVFINKKNSDNLTPASLTPRPKDNEANFTPDPEVKNLYSGKSHTVKAGQRLYALEFFSGNVFLGTMTFIKEENVFNFLAANSNPDIQTYGIDASGGVINFNKKVSEKKSAPSKVIDACKQNQTEVFAFQKEGSLKNTYAKVTSVPAMSMCVVSEMNTETSNDFGSFIYKMLYMSILASLFFIFFIIKFFTRKIGKNITDLNTRGEEVLTGKDVGEIKESPILEIQNLNKTFSYILHQLKNKGINSSAQEIIQSNLISKERGIKDEAIQNMRRFKEAVDSAEDIILMLSTDGFITYSNRALQKITGIESTKAENKKPTDLWHKKEEESIFKDSIQKTINTKSQLTFTVDGIRGDGGVFEAEIRLSPIVDSDTGIITSILMIERDISDEKQKERVKNEFISVVSHELRTPMTVVRGYSALLAEGKVGELNAKQKEYMDRINSETTRLLDLANDMLDLQKFEAGKAEIITEKMDMSTIVKDLVSEFEPLFVKKNLYIKMEDHSTNRNAMIDKRYFVRAITNLINNAFKFTEKGGVNMFLVNPDDKHIVLAIKDTGVGIPDSALPHMFSKFYQASNVLNRKQEGSGLGLSIVRKIVEAHHGMVWVESVEGTGSTFYIAVPLA